MIQRRTDEQTALTAEYALYLVDIRGVQFALDYLDTWTQQVEQVTVAQVRAAFARKLQPARMATVVLGATGPAAN